MVELRYKGKKVVLNPCCYPNMNLAVEIKIGRNDSDVLTVNFGVPEERNRAFINSNNRTFGKDILKWLTENKIAKETGLVKESGFCRYSEVVFNEAFLLENYYSLEYEEYLKEHDSLLDGEVILRVKCSHCETARRITVTKEQAEKYNEYLEGAHYLIQEIFPDFAGEMRELLSKGHICPECWKKMFGDFNENRDDKNSEIAL